MKRGFFAVAKSKSDGDGDGGGEKNETGAVVVRPATFSTLPTDTSTTLHWSFYVPVSSSSSSAVIRASPLTPIAEVALGMTTASIKLLKPHTAFQHPMPSVPLTWECREVKGKGKGLIATSRIKEGDTLFYDRPLLIFDPIRGSHSRSRAIANSEFSYAISHLTPDRQKTLADLYNAYSGLESTLGRIDTNASNVITLAGDDVTYSGVFPTFARINHSCDPNVGIEFDETLGALRVFAIRDIGIGTELETTYVVTAQKRRERRSQLMYQYRFECSCVWCGLSDEDSAVKDEERERMAKAFLKFLDAQ